MKIIVSNSLEDGAKPKTVYTLTKPSQYFNVKEPVFRKYKSDLAYNVHVLKLILMNCTWVKLRGVLRSVL